VPDIAFVLSIRLLRSSTFRLTLIYMALFGVSVLVLLVFIYWSTARFLAGQTDAAIEAEVTELAERYRADGLAGLTVVIAKRLSRKPAGSFIYLLVDLKYQQLIGNLDRWPDVPADPNGWLGFQLEDHVSGYRDVHRARARRYALEGGFHLLVGRDMHDLDAVQSLIAQALIWGFIITLVLALIGGTMMSRSTVRRIEAINETSREIMSGDLSRRIHTLNTGDDFDKLAENLNNMLDRIESLMESVRRVSDNIAHDLRTPLARLRNLLEMIRVQKNEADNSTVTVDRAVAQADEILSTFNALLRIARIESKRHRERFLSLELATLILDVAELYEPLAEEKRQKFKINLLGSPKIYGDRDLLFQAFANLVDNAIKYTPFDGSMSITVNSMQHGAQVLIADNGPGIPTAVREKVFERFYRLDESRNTPGSGLGLSLVAAVIKLHDATLVLEDNQPGLRVIIDFPNRSV
jgi:signal transduction histidine kinase